MTAGMLPISPGAIVADRYQLLELLGRGGHGAVYRAIQSPLGREVALKMMLVEALQGNGALERFAREARVVQGLEHPHTVRLYDFGTTKEGMPFSVFELLRGPTLAEEIARGPFAPHRVGHVASQVLKSLMEAHAKGIVHRDIKPSNILLLDYSGEKDFVKVLDFGVARPIVAPTPREAITHAGQIIGTPAYMAPEQVHEGAIGPATDLYALGLVMAEALTGRQVYADGSPIHVWMQQTSAEPVPLSSTVTTSPFGAIITRATRKAIHERYGSASEMLADVERAVLSSSASGVAPTSPLEAPLRPSWQSNPGRSSQPSQPVNGPHPANTTAPIVEHTAPLHVASGIPPQPLPHHSGPPMSVSTSGGAGSKTGLIVVIAVVSLVVIGALVVAAGVGGALYVRGAGEGTTTTRPPKTPPISVPTNGRLRRVDAARIVQRLEAAGWSVNSNHTTNSPGISMVFVSAQRPPLGASVQIYDYESPQMASETEKTLRTSNAGGVVERDGGRILYVGVIQSEVESRALFDAIVR